MFLLLTCLTALCLLLTIYQASKRKFKYWENKNVPHIKPLPILGNYSGYILLQKYLGQLAQKICKKFPDEPYVGAYYGTEPALIIQDPELIKLVMTKDFYYFSSREISKYTHRETTTTNLFFTDGDRWKVLRQNLTPLFSSAKMKNMFHLIEKVTRTFENILDQEVKKSNVMEVRPLTASFTMDCIGSCAFGVDTHTMDNFQKNPFKNIGEAIFDSNNVRGFKLVARAIWPAIFYGLGFQVFPKEIETFFSELLTGIFRGRQYTPTCRNDFVDLLLKLYNNKLITGDSLNNMQSGGGKKVDLAVDDSLLVAQCMLFFAAGFETSATTLSYTLFELAKNPEAQERALREVDEYLRRNDNQLKYECVTDLPYLDACFSEALRLYPVLGLLTREVVDDYTFPTGLKLEKGLRVHLPVYHMHYNPNFFPNPKQFSPERFLGEEKQNIKPYTYMPFGEGPRICIGMRFAKMQMMAGMIALLKKYRVHLAEGMKTDLDFCPTSIVTQPKQNIRLKFVEREGWEKRMFKTI